jgi:hypothetical protein
VLFKECEGLGAYTHGVEPPIRTVREQLEGRLDGAQLLKVVPNIKVPRPPLALAGNQISSPVLQEYGVVNE